MPSVVIRSFEYDSDRNELTVSFRTGKVYIYTLVPPSVAAAMRAALSKGAYFNENIRDKYQYFTEAKMDRLRAAGYTKPFTTLEEGVAHYMRNHLLADDPYL